MTDPTPLRDPDEPGDLRDLAERARRRASASALCGWLLLAEPDTELARQLVSVPSLAALGDPALAVDFERIMLRQVPPYESIFNSEDGQRGGPTAARVADSYDEIGFAEHLENRWRVGSPDHLGLELRAHAQLISTEADAWEAGRPDEAATAVESQRRFLADHLVMWAEVALDALDDAADGSAYSVLFGAIRELLHREIDLLRPAPLLDGAVVEPIPTPQGPLGPGRLARHLLAPARGGLWLGRREISAAADQLGFPWRPMDGRANLRQLIAAASDAGELGALVGPWQRAAAAAAERYEARSLAQPGAAAIWTDWHQRASGTAVLLAQLGDGALSEADDTEIVVRISGAGAHEALTVLHSAGYHAERLD